MFDFDDERGNGDYTGLRIEDRGSRIEDRGSKIAPLRAVRFSILDLLSSWLSASRRPFDVAAEFLAHRRERFFREGTLLARTEACEERDGQHVHGHGLFDRRLDRPPPFARILHKARVVRERRVFE